MSIRILALYIFVTFLSIYAWKDWFKSLCGLIVLMAFLEHPDMPSKVMGIQGLNPWNIVMATVLLAWFVQRRKEGHVFDMPRHVKLLIGIYFLIILIGSLRIIVGREDLPMTFAELISEYFINAFKWVIPGFLLFDGCRSRERVKFSLIVILLLGFFLALQVSYTIPLGYVFTSMDAYRGSKIEWGIGYNAVDISTILAGVSWGMIAMVGFFRQRWLKVLLLLSVGFTLYSQALTGGRAGYLAWGATGLVLCLIKWRKYLILAPVIVILLPIVFPSATERSLTGFDQTNVAGQRTTDTYSMTSGRILIWPYVISKIGESPMVGYGRLAMIRTGLTSQVRSEVGEFVQHPHNAYLEWLLDNGLAGFLPVLIFYLVVYVYSMQLFRDRTDPLHSAVGALALAMVTSQLVGSIGAQSFYPREGTVAMWCAIGLALRMTVERAKVSDVVFDRNVLYCPLPALSRTAVYSNTQ